MAYLPEEVNASEYTAPPPVSPTSDSYSTGKDALGEESKAVDVIMLDELRSDRHARERGEVDTAFVATNSDRRVSISSGNVRSVGDVNAGVQSYRLYKKRFVGLVAIMVLNCAGGMNWPWFGPIANDTSETFGISLDEVNWLGNIIALTYIVFAPFVPVLCSRYGLRTSYFVGSAFLIAGAWVRYAGTAKSLSSRGAYALLIIGQFLGAVAQAIFQVLAPKFSETWFDLKGRTTATMLMSIANPVGGALGQLISPLITGVRSSVLVLGIISTIAAPCALVVGAQPPTPPSYSGSQPTPHFLTTLRAIFGLLPRPVPFAVANSKDVHADINCIEDTYMTLRERIDFAILATIFGVLVAGTNTFSLLSNELLEPYGYSDDTAGFMGAALLLSGIVAAIITAPLFDRVFTHHLGLAARIFAPIIAACWLALIWAVRQNNTATLYALFVLIGVFSVTMLPVGLEMGCELTRNSSASSAILWWSGNLFGIIFVLIMSALRDSDSASPPRNMRRALIFNGATIFSITMTIFLFRGRQRRRELDMNVTGGNRTRPNATGVEGEQGGFLVALRHRVGVGRNATRSGEASDRFTGAIDARGSDEEAFFSASGKGKIEKDGRVDDVL